MKEIKTEPQEDETAVGREIKSEPIKREPVNDDDYSIQNSELLVPKLEEPDDFEYPNYMKIEPNPEKDFMDLLVPDEDPSSSRPNQVKMEAEPQDEHDFSELLVPETEEPNHLDCPSSTKAPLVHDNMAHIKLKPVDFTRAGIGCLQDPVGHTSIAGPSRLSKPNPEEMDFYPDYMKVEPYPEEEFTDLLVPEKETSPNPDKVKLEPEPQDEYDFSDLLEPKLEKIDDYSDLLVTEKDQSPSGPNPDNVKLEPELEEDLSDPLVRDQSSSSQVKSEPEPHDEDDFSDLLKPETEEPDHLNRPSSPIFGYSSRELNDSFLKRKKKSYRCSVCFTTGSSDIIAQTFTMDRRLIILLGSILNEQKTMEEAKHWFRARGFYFCKSHLPEVAQSIYKILEISNIGELESCSIDNRKKLMTIVNELDAELNFDAFEQFFTDFMVKMNLLESMAPGNVYRQLKTATPYSRPFHAIRRTCSVCSHRKPWIEMQGVSPNNRKLILMVGSILSGKKTKKEAMKTMSPKIIPVCKPHFSETIAQIFEVLNIKNVYKMTFSPSYKQNLMPIINFLNPNCDFAQFKIAMKDFCQRAGEM